MEHNHHAMMDAQASSATTMPITMAGASMTMAMDHSKMNHGSMNHAPAPMAASSVGMSSNHMMSMPMVFGADFAGFKVLFDVWEVNDPWQFFVTLLSCFVIAFFYELLRIYRHNHFIKDCKSRKRFMCFGAAASLPSSPRPTSVLPPPVNEVKSCCHSEATPVAAPIETNADVRKSVDGNSTYDCCHSNGVNNNNNNSANNNSAGVAESTVVLLNTTSPNNSVVVARSGSVAGTKRKNNQPMGMLSHVHILQTLMHVVLTALGFLIMLAVMTFNVWVFMSIVAGVGVGYFIAGHLLESPVDANSCCL